MDAISDHDLGEAIQTASAEAASEQRPSLVSVAAALRTRIADPANPLSEIATALECSSIDGRDEPEVLALWARALACAPGPLVGARFADLLWSARYGDAPPEWAQRAVDAYLAAAHDQFGHVLEISEGLQRALGVATEIDDQPRRGAAIEALVGLANRSISSEPRSSGVALSIIEFLAGQPPAVRPVELSALLERALYRYRDDAWLLEPTLDIKAGLVEPAAREALHVAQVDAFARLARNSTGSLRYAHFEHAIARAECHELAALAQQLRDEVAGRVTEQIAEPERDPIPEAEVVEPRDPVADFIDRIVGTDSLGEALARFGASLPTEGHGDAPDDAEMQRMTYFGGLAVDLLARIRAEYGPVRAARAWFECPLIDASIASGLADGIDRYESGDFDAAASVLASELERITRSIATAAGVTVTPRRDDGLPATDTPWISDVLAALRGALYEPSRRYVRALLSETTTTEAPNDLELETTEGVTPPDAALLVHAACHLRLLQPVSGTVN